MWKCRPRSNLVLDKMLAAEVKYRYQSWAELIAQLQDLGLAHERLSFNPSHLDPVVSAKAEKRMEVLLVDDGAENILLAQEFVLHHYGYTNLNVVRGVEEAHAFLNQAAGYA